MNVSQRFCFLKKSLQKEHPGNMGEVNTGIEWEEQYFKREIST